MIDRAWVRSCLTGPVSSIRPPFDRDGAIDYEALRRVLDFNIADNAGNRVQDRPIAPDGPAAYFATLPVRVIKEQLCAAGIPAAVSNSAGTYLCNQVMYTALHWAANHKPTSQIGFLHVPALPEQMAGHQRPGPSMAFSTMLAGVHIILDTLR